MYRAYSIIGILVIHPVIFSCFNILQETLSIRDPKTREIRKNQSNDLRMLILNPIRSFVPDGLGVKSLSIFTN